MPVAQEHGAALIALTIDEEGQARDREWKLRIARRLIADLTTRWGISISDIIIDCLTFPIATGQEETRRDALETIEVSGRHLLQLINDILDLAKVAANKVDLEMSCVNLRELCEQCLLLVRPQGLKKQLDLNLTFPDRAIAMPLDARRIRQALINLLGNAVKFTPSGGQITLAVEVEPQSVSFHVMDTGIGIAEEHLDKLFQPFSQVDSKLNRLHNGTGLGLALVKHIAELHGGSVKVQSTLGQEIGRAHV